MRADHRVFVVDSTLREGQQTYGVVFTPEGKLEIARQLERARVDMIEVGHPFRSPEDLPTARNIAHQIRETIVVALGYAAEPTAVDLAWDSIRHAERPRIALYLPCSDIRLETHLRQTRQQALETAVAAVKRARDYCPDVEFAPTDATRADPQYVCQMVQAVIAAGAGTIELADSVGYALPGEYAQLVRRVQSSVPNIEGVAISVHSHDDLGLALANTLEGLRAGARQVSGCFNGLGERAGSVALEEVVIVLHTRRDFYEFTTGVDTTQIYSTSQLISRVTGVPIQPNKPIVGANAFRHGSRIHQAGAALARENYEIMDRRVIGWPEKD